MVGYLAGAAVGYLLGIPVWAGFISGGPERKLYRSDIAKVVFWPLFVAALIVLAVGLGLWRVLYRFGVWLSDHL